MSLTKVTYSMIDGVGVNAKDFGAVGDGVTSDTAAIQALFDAAISSGAKEIFFPSGTYLISCNRTDLDYTCAIIIDGLKNCVVRGTKNTKFTKNTSGTGPAEYGFFRVQQCEDVTFTNFEMDSTGIAFSNNANRSRGFLLATIDVNNKAINLLPNKNLEFSYIYAHDQVAFVSYALRDETIFPGPPAGEGLYIHDCRTYNIRSDHPIGIGYYKNVVIQNNRFINPLALSTDIDNMAVDMSAAVNTGLVQNNYVYGFPFGMKSESRSPSGYFGAENRSSQRILFDNNYLEQIGNPAVILIPGPGGGDTFGIKLNSKGSAATNNTIIARDISITTGGLGIGVAALNSSNTEATALVDGNYIVSSVYGVLHTDAAGATRQFTTTIRNNRIVDSKLHGINAGANCTIENNRIYRTISEAIQIQSPDQTYVRNNFAFNCASTNNPTIADTVVFSQVGTGAQGYLEFTGNIIEDTRGASAAKYGYFFNAYGMPSANQIVFTPGVTSGLFTAIAYDKYFSAVGTSLQLPGTLVPAARTIVVTNNPSLAAPWNTMPWNAGDTAVFSVPTVGLPKGYVCTVGGTPGTWVSQGNL